MLCVNHLERSNFSSWIQFLTIEDFHGKSIVTLHFVQQKVFVLRL